MSPSDFAAAIQELQLALARAVLEEQQGKALRAIHEASRAADEAEAARINLEYIRALFAREMPKTARPS